MRNRRISRLTTNCGGYVVAQLDCGHRRQVRAAQRVGDAVQCEACSLAEWEQRFAAVFTAADFARLEFARWLLMNGHFSECERDQGHALAA